MNIQSFRLRDWIRYLSKIYCFYSAVKLRYDLVLAINLFDYIIHYFWAHYSDMSSNKQ